MDFVIPLPKSRRGNTALLLFQYAFTGFVIAKSMSDTTAFKVAQVFEECIYRRFGALSLIRHDRDPRFMSEVFQAFAEMMQSSLRATLSYRPQANGQQGISVKMVMQSVTVYAEDPLQQDWDEIAEHLVFAINNSMDTTRKETHFYLVHGWDASSTMKAMTTSLRHGTPNSPRPLRGDEKSTDKRKLRGEWTKITKSETSQQRPEKASLQNEEAEDSTRQDGEDSATKLKTSKTKLFEEGRRAWLYMERVKPGLTKKLAHRWHRPFRIKKKADEFAFELELPDKSGYCFYPVVHISRLKPVNEFSSRPTTLLAPEIAEDSRMDFDEVLLPDDSCEPYHIAGEYEVEVILDDRRPLQTSTEKSVREFEVKWVGYDEPTWEPASHLSCGGLLYDYLQRKKE
ncbi:hypothetical protein PHMEG_00031052 [Phytophthora megakarya]|uniref:Reverse transcriptase n=1 Tax=Phytophthora megakarya TaxID=4795 RepID=A0A225UYP1_9STRA|nr:hypothetical protein PHMEG_00031052 [Phytophthora megakarya]